MRRRSVLVAAALALACLAAYAPTRSFRYVQDAYHAVKINPVVERGDVREIYTSDYWKDTISLARTLYRPTTVWSFAIERRLAGESDPGVSHLVNAALHGLVAFLLFLLARRLGAGDLGATAAALLFATHPLMLQGVANVVGRADVLAALFGLGALLCLARGGRAGAWGAGGLAFLAATSKEVGLAFFPLLAVLALGPLRRDEGRTRRADALAVAGSLAPALLAALVWLHLRTVAIGEFPGQQPLAVEDNVLVGLEGGERAATALGMLARYAALLVWPAGMSPDHSGAVIEPETTWLALRPLAGAALLVGLAALALRPWIVRRTGRAGQGSAAWTAPFGAWLFLAPYLLVGNLIVLNAAGFAERMLYVAATGAALLAGCASEALVLRSPEPRRRAATAACAAVLALAALAGIAATRRLAPMWATNEAMFERARQATPRSLRANLELAGRLEAEGRDADALAVYERINGWSPGYGGAWLARGAILARRGDLAAAERAFRRAVASRPGVGEAHMNLGLVLAQTGRSAEAERELRRALLLEPRLVKAAAQLGHLLFQDGRYAEAARFYRGCVELGREDLRGQLREARARAARLAPAR